MSVGTRIYVLEVAKSRYRWMMADRRCYVKLDRWLGGQVVLSY